jgi:hypothetical protein
MGITTLEGTLCARESLELMMSPKLGCWGGGSEEGFEESTSARSWKGRKSTFPEKFQRKNTLWISPSPILPDLPGKRRTEMRQ